MPKQIYMGNSNFADIRSDPNYLYVDKSSLIKEFFLNGAAVSLILRPRRFGKTLNLSMLCEFFSVRKGLAVGAPNLFAGLKISEDPDFCTPNQNKYPVIFISLKALEAQTLEQLLEKVTQLIYQLFLFYAAECHSAIEILRQSNEQEDVDALEQNLMAFLKQKATQSQLEQALHFLSQCLELYYGQKVIILIDEYDAVLNFVWREYLKRKRVAHECGRELSDGEHEAWHNKIIEINTFIRHFLGAALKDNPHLAKGLMTGIYPMTKRDSASDLNNVRVFSLLDNQYGDFFGFTEDEINWVIVSIESCVVPSELKNWYNGYQAGTHHLNRLYNPWSVLTCLSNGEIHAYWEETGNHDLIRDHVLKEEDSQFKEAVAQLSHGAAVECELYPFMNFEQEERGFESVMTTLFYTGYLTVTGIVDSPRYKYMLRAPNKEIYNVYGSVIEEWLKEKFFPSHYEAFLVNLLLGKVELFSKELNDFLLQSISVFEATLESNYHMFMAGLLISLRNTYDMYFNNIESGHGRPDTLIIPLNSRCSRGLILEYKCVTEKLRADESLIESKLREKTLMGLGQINHNQYETQARKFGHIHEILVIGITFYKKYAAIAAQTKMLSSENRLSDITLYLPNKPKEILSASAAISRDETMSAFDLSSSFFGKKRSLYDADLASLQPDP